MTFRHVSEVVKALLILNWTQITCLYDVRQPFVYFETYHMKINYDHFLYVGYPIGSGTMGSGVNTVDHHHLKRQGQSWERQNAQSM
ncbi:MAG: hypothetical protein WCK35_29710 [Chloroflexota bacterium]